MEHIISLVGLNHRTAAVDTREKFALTQFCSPETWAVPPDDLIEESLILSTCNRVEVLAVGRDPSSLARILDRWSAARGQKPEDLLPYVYQYQGQKAITHLFNVASSLDSLVLGEPQILGQLKQAYRFAVEAHSTGSIINRLLHKAFSVAKRVRTETAVASNAVSISYAAVELAKRIFDDLDKRQAMLIGAGEMAELAAMHLVQAGVKRILVANRTLERGQELAATIGSSMAEAITFDDIFTHLVHSDIVISSTGASTTVIQADDIREVLRKRKHSPMFFIDIAMPRDIAPDVNNLDNVYLYDIDDLKEVVEENLAQRRDEATKASEIVREETEAFKNWVDSLQLQPAIVALVQRAEHMAAQEVQRTLKRLSAQGPVDDSTREALEHMAASLVRKFNHEPLCFLKERDEKHENRATDIIRRVFNI